MGAVLNCISFIFEVKISCVSVIYIRIRIRQLMADTGYNDVFIIINGKKDKNPTSNNNAS